jgi:hypothetical protein
MTQFSPDTSQLPQHGLWESFGLKREGVTAVRTELHTKRFQGLCRSLNVVTVMQAQTTGHAGQEKTALEK